MNISSLIYIILFTLVILTMFRNLFCFIFLKDKVYFSFFLFLLGFSLILFLKRVYPMLDRIYFSCIDIIFGMLNFVFISGATVLFSKYFLNIDSITKSTKRYFIIQMIIALFLILINFFAPNLELYSKIVHGLVFFYAIYLFLIILYHLKFNMHHLTSRYFIRYLLFLLMQGNIIVIMFYYTINKSPPVYFLSSIFIVIIYLEIELLLKSMGNDIKIKNQMNLDSFDQNIIDKLMNGKIYKEISYELNIPVNTLKKRISNIYYHYGVDSRNELILKILNNSNKK